MGGKQSHLLLLESSHLQNLISELFNVTLKRPCKCKSMPLQEWIASTLTSADMQCWNLTPSVNTTLHPFNTIYCLMHSLSVKSLYLMKSKSQWKCKQGREKQQMIQILKEIYYITTQQMHLLLPIPNLENGETLPYFRKQDLAME